MPLKADVTGMRRLRRSFEGIVDPEGTGRVGLVSSIQGEVKGLLKEEFATGIGPDGSPWTETVRGRAALISKKLPGAFSSRIDRGIVRFTGKSTRDLLTAHQFGHTFAARKVGAQKNFLSFNAKGKLVAQRRIFKKDGTVRRGAYQRFAAAHEIRERVLVARQIYPEGTMPLRWEEAIKRGLASGMQQWAERTEK